MAPLRSGVASAAYTIVVLAVVVIVQILNAPALVEVGPPGVAFLSIWSLGGLLLGVVPHAAHDEASALSAVSWGVAGLSLVLGRWLTLSHHPLGDLPAALGATLVLASVAVQPRRYESPDLAAPHPAEPAPHLWS